MSGPDRDDLLARRRRVIGPSLSLSYREPLTIVRGEGAYLYDDAGRGYLDLVNNVAHVGHAHPRVVEAAARQKALPRDEHPLPPPGHPRLRGAPGRDPARAARGRLPRELGERGERARPAARPRRHGPPGCRGARRRVSRQHGRPRRHQPVQVRWPRRRRPTGARARRPVAGPVSRPPPWRDASDGRRVRRRAAGDAGGRGRGRSTGRRGDRRIGAGVRRAGHPAARVPRRVRSRPPATLGPSPSPTRSRSGSVGSARPGGRSSWTTRSPTS